MNLFPKSSPIQLRVNRFVNDQHQRKLTLVSLFSAIGTIAFFIFGVVHLRLGDRLVGMVEIQFGLLGVGILLFIYRYRNVDRAATFTLFTLLMGLIFLLITGGLQGTGIFWYFTLPPLAFFLKGKKAGLLWIISTLIITYLLALFHFLGQITLPYEWITIRQMTVSFAVVAIFIYAYELINQQSEDLIAQEKEQAEAIISNMGDGMIATTGDGTITAVNISAQTMLKYLGPELINKQFADVMEITDEHQKVIEKSESPLTAVLKEGKTRQYYNYFFTRKDKIQFPVSLTIAPIQKEDRITGAVVTFHDVSVEKHIDQTKSEFVTLASHQLRTPISAISWYTEMLLHGDSGEINEKQKEHLTQVYRSTRRLAGLVDALLNVSRVELNNFIIKAEQVDIKKLAHITLLEQKNRFLEGKMLTFEESYAENLPEILADPAIIKIILLHILSNAIKYTPDNGTVTLTIEGTSSTLFITVKDTGYGIPLAEQKEIFTKLYRASNIKEKDTDGTGLGLYLTKSLVQIIGGRILLQSDLNRGTVVTVQIPLPMKTQEGTSELISSDGTPA